MMALFLFSILSETDISVLSVALEFIDALYAINEELFKIEVLRSATAEVLKKNHDKHHAVFNIAKSR